MTTVESHSRTAPIFQLKITLLETKPPVWRRVEVPGDVTLPTLHRIVQEAMGSIVKSGVRAPAREQVAVEEVADPRIARSDDALVRVTTSAICGSDLHAYHREFPDRDGWVLGHEFVGVVEEVGPEAVGVRKGQRVVVPFHGEEPISEITEEEEV